KRLRGRFERRVHSGPVGDGAGAEHLAGRRVGQVERAGHACSRWVGANSFSNAGRTTTDGPGVRSAAARSAPTVSKEDRVAGTPKDEASATKSGRASSVAVVWPKAPVRYSRRTP